MSTPSRGERGIEGLTDVFREIPVSAHTPETFTSPPATHTNANTAAIALIGNTFLAMTNHAHPPVTNVARHQLSPMSRETTPGSAKSSSSVRAELPSNVVAMIDVDRARALTPGTAARNHLNNVGVAPIPEAVLDAQLHP